MNLLMRLYVARRDIAHRQVAVRRVALLGIILMFKLMHIHSITASPIHLVYTCHLVVLLQHAQQVAIVQRQFKPQLI